MTTNQRYGKVVAGVKKIIEQEKTIQLASWRNYPNWMISCIEYWQGLN